MKDIVYYNNLFDCYNALLTSKEKLVYEDYYSNDLTLAEIAENRLVSRSAIQKTIKTAINKMENYEKQLALLAINEKLKDCLTITDVNKIHQLINKILAGE